MRAIVMRLMIALPPGRRPLQWGHVEVSHVHLLSCSVGDLMIAFRPLMHQMPIVGAIQVPPSSLSTLPLQIAEVCLPVCS